jgi:peptidoglycan glycosyltransferase
MIRKGIAFLKECWKTRTAYAYAGLMLAACILVYNLYSISGSNLLKTEEQKEAISSSTSEAARQYGVKNAVRGDVTDRNGTTIVSTASADAETVYKDALAYTQAIGFSNSIGDYLLIGGNKSYLYDTLPGTDKGCTIQTTLDSTLQEYCFSKLQNLCKEDGSEAEGSIVVLDAKTGRVLTWAFYPSFDVAELSETYEKINNSSSTSVDWQTIVAENLGSVTYPLLNPRMPGSIFKIVTSIAIIEQGQSCLDETVYDGTGYLEIDGTTLSNSQGAVYGEVDFTKAFVNSVNVYFAKKAIEDVGKSALDSVAKRCGLDRLFYFDFGRMNSSYAFEDTNQELARTAIGQQNVQLSAMQVAMITMGAACDGQIAEPHMIQEIFRTVQSKTAEGSVYTKGETVQSEKIDTNYMNIMSAETSEVIQAAMVAKGEALKQKTGLDLVVNGESYSIGCKSGTAEIDNTYGGYSGYNNIWLTSYAPADDPQYIVVVNRYHVDGDGANSYGDTLFGDLIDVYDKIYELDQSQNDADTTEEENGDV